MGLRLIIIDTYVEVSSLPFMLHFLAQATAFSTNKFDRSDKICRACVAVSGLNLCLARFCATPVLAYILFGGFSVVTF